MGSIAPDAISQLFTDAHTYPSWEAREVPDQLLRELYDLVKLGPTSANLSPLRIIFVKNGAKKDALLATVAEMNKEKVKTAPVTAILARDSRYFDKADVLWPHNKGMRDYFAGNLPMADEAGFRNSSISGGYFILAARALGLDCGPMSGFDNKKLDEALLAGTGWVSNFICNIGYGDRSKIRPRLPRLPFDEACRIV